MKDFRLRWRCGPLRVVLGATLTLCFSSTFAFPQTDPTLGVVLARARAYLKECQERWAITICQEDYVQEVFGLRRVDADTVDTVRQETRVLGSDFLFVWLPTSQTWMGVRDVTTVDGQPVSDHVGRLMALLARSDASLVGLKALADESARFNIGPAARNLNEPMVALRVLDEVPPNQFQFKLAGQEEIAGVRVQRVAYKETGRPTLLRGLTPSRGVLWIDPATGRIHRTRLQADDAKSRARATIEVDYALQPGQDIWAPSQMREDYDAFDSRVKGKATYTNFRRFGTSVKIVEPK